MQKNEGLYTFLLSHSSKTHIRIRRFEVSKKLLQSGVLALFLIVSISLMSIGIAGVIKNSQLIENIENSSIVSQTVLAQTIQQNAIDYSRPADNFIPNSGGPAEIDNSGSDMEGAELEKQLKVIKTTSDPAAVPTMWAHAGKVNNEYGFRRNPFGGRSYEFHSGMDIDGERGDLVVAPAGGTVVKAGWSGGYGQMVEIDHGNGLITRYAHLSKIDAEVGDTVTRGQLIAYVGSTGRSTGPHLHYEIRLNERSINPRHFLPPEPAELIQLN